MGSSIGTTNVDTKPSDSVEMTPKGVNYKQSVTVTLKVLLQHFIVW